MRGFTLSSGIGKIPNIDRFLGLERLSRNPVTLAASSCKAIYSWGHKPYSKWSRILANVFGLEHIRLEDGFVCSFGQGGRQRKYSLLLDSQGIYYDARTPSRLENILNNLDQESWQLTDTDTRAHASELMQSLVAGKISKYNVVAKTEIASNDIEPYVLVVDQTLGDQSVQYGGMHVADFEWMLLEALSKFPREQILVKIHPDVQAGRKEGYLSALAKAHNVSIITGDLPLQLCKAAYVGTSLYGFELLMHSVPVVCFGQPFYAGWGLTEDKKPLARRSKQRSLLELFIASYLLYPIYIDPVTGEQCTLRETIDHVLEQRRQYKRVDKDYLLLGITPWKRGYIDRYVMGSEFDHQFMTMNQLEQLPDTSANKSPSVLVWGKRAPESAQEKMLQSFHVARMEDGFVRSVGLGSNFTAPRSLVIDDLGIYFDATQPSRLEYLLENRDCSSEEISRAQALIDMLLANRITKYTQPESAPQDLTFYTDQCVLLVIGQVQGDASLRYGTDQVDSNLKLLQRVRSNHPESVVVYKPHPDVVSGNRSDGIDNYGQIEKYCDRVETELSIEITLPLCDQVHTMTSLAGLEALLCGTDVVTYGMPFYAGWGLTEDHCQFERRTRKRTLSELVYLTYIEYPTYLDIDSGEFTSVEKTVTAMVTERKRNTVPITASGVKKYVNIARNIKKGLTYAA